MADEDFAMTLAQQIDLSRSTDITPDGSDYETVRQVIEMLTLDYQSQPSLEVIAERLGQSPTQLQKTFTRWAAGSRGIAVAGDVVRTRPFRPWPPARSLRYP
jgi:AraC-like DNA-binding protein